MSTAQLHGETPEAWRLEGELSFATIPALLADIEQRGELPRELDLAGVTRSDSAGLALLVELAGRASRHDHALRLSNFPAQLVSLAEISGVRELLEAEGIRFDEEGRLSLSACRWTDQANTGLALDEIEDEYGGA